MRSNYPPRSACRARSTSSSSRSIADGPDSRSLLVVQVIALLTAAFLARRERRVLVPTLLALFFVLGAQVLFWVYTYPANAVTANWTVQTDDWMRLRRMWEYSHLAGLQVLALTCLIAAVMSRLPDRKRNYHTY